MSAVRLAMLPAHPASSSLSDLLCRYVTIGEVLLVATAS
jgi:hypothetical protein